MDIALPVRIVEPHFKGYRIAEAGGRVLCTFSQETPVSFVEAMVRLINEEAGYDQAEMAAVDGGDFFHSGIL